MRRGRRFRPDPLDPIQAPAWLVVRTPAEGNRVLESARLEPLTNLRIVFLGAVCRRMSDGWIVGDFGPGASIFFCSRGGERISVEISRLDPHAQPVNDRSTAWNVVPLKPKGSS